MKSLLAKLFGMGSHLSNLEKLLLDAVRAHLSPELALIWNQQVRAINKVQRLPEGVEVNFYRMSKGRATFNEGLAFQNKTPELLLATLHVLCSKPSIELVARVWCVKGFLFSIEYSEGAAYFEEAAGMDPPPIHKITCTLNADLTQAAR